MQFYGANEDCKLRFYTACFLPVLIYALGAWFEFLSRGTRDQLERTQNHALKLIYSNLDSYEQRLMRPGLMSIADLYTKRSRNCFNNLPACFDDVLVLYANTEIRSNRHHSNSKYRFSFKTSLFKKSFFISNFLNS